LQPTRGEPYVRAAVRAAHRRIRLNSGAGPSRAPSGEEVVDLAGATTRMVQLFFARDPFFIFFALFLMGLAGAFVAGAVIAIFNWFSRPAGTSRKSSWDERPLPPVMRAIAMLAALGGAWFVLSIATRAGNPVQAYIVTANGEQAIAVVHRELRDRRMVPYVEVRVYGADRGELRHHLYLGREAASGFQVSNGSLAVFNRESEAGVIDLATGRIVGTLEAAEVRLSIGAARVRGMEPTGVRVQTRDGREFILGVDALAPGAVAGGTSTPMSCFEDRRIEARQSLFRPRLAKLAAAGIDELVLHDDAAFDVRERRLSALADGERLWSRTLDSITGGREPACAAIHEGRLLLMHPGWHRLSLMTLDPASGEVIAAR
jgi:hypothetical protein